MESLSDGTGTEVVYKAAANAEATNEILKGGNASITANEITDSADSAEESHASELVEIRHDGFTLSTMNFSHCFYAPPFPPSSFSSSAAAHLFHRLVMQA
jgi:hypothetical protein